MKIVQQCMALLIAAALSASALAQVMIDFTQVPAVGEGSESQGNIAGNVGGLENPERYKIVLYAHTDWWYVQPLVSDPYTDIASDGRWSNWTHLGHRYAALVVRATFQPPAKTLSLPHVSGDVIAKAEVAAKAK